VKHEPLEQIARSRYWMGQSKQEYTWGKRISKRLSLPLDRGHERRIREVLQEDGRASCVSARMKETYHGFPICCLHVTMITLYP
jgi:hypothetical protein